MPNGKTPKELGYETEDVGWSFIIWSAVILTGFTLVTIFGLLWIFGARDLYKSIGDKTVVSTAEERPLPAGPRLQAQPPLDMDAYKTSAMNHLHNFGWVDESVGIVHIPIERAMEKALEEGFAFGPPPARVAEPEAPAIEETP